MKIKKYKNESSGIEFSFKERGYNGK